jgi:uncharacterized repeat protein (TIGR02543 family)
MRLRALSVITILGGLHCLGPAALFAQTVLTPRVTLTAPTYRDQDDMCFWIHPTDPTLSTIITSDKGAGKLFVYDLAGTTLQTIVLAGGDPGNVDLRYNFDLQGVATDIVGLNERSSSKLMFYRVNPDTRLLDRIDNDAIVTAPDNYGFGLYRSPVSGKHYAFSPTQDGVVEQFELIDVAGQIGGAMVRTWDLGRITESVVSDDENATVFFGEEDEGIWKFGAEPTDPTVGTLIATVGDSSGLTADVEGLTIYYAAGGGGYLIASSQGSSEYKVYDRRAPHAYVKTFSIANVFETDGIDVTNVSLGPTFPAGMFAAHSHIQNVSKPVQVCGFEDVGLPIDTGYWNPRTGGSDALPSILSMNPQIGPVGTEVTLVGLRFELVTAVDFDGTPASFTIDSDTSLRAIVPIGATTGRIHLTNPSGTRGSPEDFVVIDPPAIASFSPESGPVGTEVTVTGTELGTVTSVQFNGASATFTIDGPTQLRATVPGDATSGPITITNPAGTSISANPFAVTVVSGFALTTAVVGSGTITRTPDLSSYDAGAIVELSAIPSSGWSFAGWSGDATGTTSPASVLMDGDKSVTATFTLDTGPLVLTFTSVHDGRVQSDAPTTVYGSTGAASLLRIRGTGPTVRSYLKFDIAGLPGPVQSAKLRLYCVDDSPDGGSVFAVGNNYVGSSTPWLETGLTWNNAPAVGGVALDHRANVALNTSIEFDVTSAVSVDGVYSFALTSGSTNIAAYSPKEGAQPPQLVIETSAPPITHALNTSVVGSGAITRVPDLTSYDQGSMVELTATPDAGWSFAGWSGDATGMANPVSLFMDGDKSAIATFTINTYTLTTVIVGSGTVARVPDQATYAHGAGVELTATPADGFVFTGWSGDVAGFANPTSVTMDGNKSVTATFGLDTGPSVLNFTSVHDGRVQSDNPGTVYGATGSGALLRVRGTNPTVRSYLKFDVTGIVSTIESAQLRLYCVDDSPDGGSLFTVANDYLGSSSPWLETGLTWNNAPAVGGSALDQKTNVVLNTWVEFDVTAAITGDGTYSFALSGGSTNIVAYSPKEGVQPPQLVIEIGGGPITHTLTTLVVGSGTVARVPDQPSYDHGAIVELTADPAPGFTFTGWSGDVVGLANPVSVVMDANQTVTATFAINAYTLETALIGSGTITRTPDQSSYQHGATVELLATAATGSTFTGWSGDATGSTNPLSVLMDSDQRITATFALDAGPSILTFTSIHDGRIQSDGPNTTYGSTGPASLLRVRSTSPTVRSYLKFDVAGLSGVVQSAKLRLYCVDDSPDGAAVYAVANDYLGTSTPWLETGLTWNNAPAVGGTAFDHETNVALGTWVEFEVTASITGNGAYSFALTSGSTNIAAYSPKEGVQPPQLVIQVEPAVLHAPPSLSKSGPLLTLGAARPTPFSHQTSVRFELARPARVTALLFDVSGRVVRDFGSVDLSPGSHDVVWDGRDGNGRPATSGSYWLRLEAPGASASRRLVLSR